MSRTRQLALLLAFLSALAAVLPGGESAEGQDKEQAKGLFVAVGYGGRRLCSHDGKTWENDVEWAANGGDDNNCLFSVAFAKGKFVAVGGGAGVGHILVTRDGKDWQEVLKAKNRVVPVIFGNNRFVVGQGRNFLISEDGVKWQEGGKLDFPGGLWFRRAAFGNGVFVFCGDCDGKPQPNPRNGWRATTADGVTIEAFVSDLPNTRSVAFGAGRFVLVGEKSYRGTSTDGKEWTSAPDPDEDFRWVVWTGKQFVLNGKAAWTSPDGLKWVKVGPALPAEPLAHGPGGFTGASWKTNLWLSPDGLTWKKTSTAGTNAITAMAWGEPE
jgi:hypothetical protein